MPPYIRVAAKINDPYTKVSMIRSVAFKSDDGSRGPFGSVNDVNKPAFVAFVTEEEVAESNGAYKKMLVPTTSSNETLVNEPTDMIAFHDKVYNNDETHTSPVEDDTQKYYVYIYAKNETGYEFIQPSSVTVVTA
jgi:hypothetical protein